MGQLTNQERQTDEKQKTRKDNRQSRGYNRATEQQSSKATQERQKTEIFGIAVQVKTFLPRKDVLQGSRSFINGYPTINQNQTQNMGKFILFVYS